jgi:iron complex transport system ATP-binding protein
MVSLSVKGLSYQRGAFTLSLPELAIASGEKVALMGENGCGKSTLINLLSGLIPTYKSAIYYQERPLEAIDHAERARIFSVLVQFADVSFPFSVREVALLGRFAQMSARAFSPEDIAKTMALLSRFDLTRYADRSFAELSGGERRRVMIARVLNQQTPIVFLDEPNASLDIRHTLEVFSYLYGLSQTVVASVHDINLAHRYFDRFLFFKGGKLLHDVARDDVTPAILSEVYDVSVSADTACFNFSPNQLGV